MRAGTTTVCGGGVDGRGVQRSKNGRAGSRLALASGGADPGIARESLIARCRGAQEPELRLRYHVRREFAPYIGIVRERAFGKTADYRRQDGEDIDDTRFVAGLRIWF